MRQSWTEDGQKQIKQMLNWDLGLAQALFTIYMKVYTIRAAQWRSR